MGPDDADVVDATLRARGDQDARSSNPVSGSSSRLAPKPSVITRVTVPLGTAYPGTCASSASESQLQRGGKPARAEDDPVADPEVELTPRFDQARQRSGRVTRERRVGPMGERRDRGRHRETAQESRYDAFRFEGHGGQ